MLGGDAIAGNYIGTDPTGTISDPDGTPSDPVNLGNRGIGLFVHGSPDNTIGGTTAADRNLFAGNANQGAGVYGLGFFVAADITIAGPSATGNVVSGNFIGTDVTGTKPLGQDSETTGLDIANAPGNIVGGTATGAGNVVSNTGGVAIDGNGSSGNLIAGNFIGTDRTGSVYLGDLNGGSVGVEISGASGNTVGGTVAGARNVITGGIKGTGINIVPGLTDPANANLVEGNYIGVVASGSSAMLQYSGQALADAGTDETIGGTAAGAGNVMAGSINLSGIGDLLEGNLIGTDATGLVALSGGGGTVQVGGTANTVGGTTAAARNVILGSLVVTGQYAPGTPANNLIQGNFIGTDITGRKLLSSGSLLLLETSDNTIGGTAAGAGNVIVGSYTGSGIEIGDGSSGQPTEDNLIQGNFIGIDPTGTTDFGLGSVGITLDAETGVQNVSDNTIGGTAAGAGNVIAHNVAGVVIGGTDPGNSILGNSIFDNDVFRRWGSPWVYPARTRTHPGPRTISRS